MKKLLKKDDRGFTLAELLIVVAIIAVLVAISIPIFTTQLEKSREGVDAANIRAAYAECAVAVLDASETNYYKEVEITQTEAGFKKLDADTEVGGIKLSSLTTVKKDSKNAFVGMQADGTAYLGETAPTGTWTELP